MSRNVKIDKINAYKKMLESKKLPSIKEEKNPTPKNPEDPSTWSVEEQIHDEFTKWAEAQLADLLGEDRPAAPDTESVYDVFTADQVDVLQQFADKMLEKASGQAPQKTTPVRPEKTRTSNSGGYVPPKDAKPIGNRQREREAQAKISQKQPKNAFLDELDRMDRDFDPER